LGGGEFQSIGSPGPLSSARLPSISKLPTDEDPWTIPASSSANTKAIERASAVHKELPLHSDVYRGTHARRRALVRKRCDGAKAVLHWGNESLLDVAGARVGAR